MKRFSHLIALASVALSLSGLLSAPAHGATAKVAKPDLAAGEAKAAVCLACHTADGSRGTPAYPILQGQHPEYLVKQLTEFKSGKRNNAIMKGFATALSDDDMRNIFAITSVLEGRKIEVTYAENGKVAIEMLKNHPKTDLVLMDIMMPNMNGYEAIQEIRKNPDWEHLPIIAVTAKAMNGDREKCMEAGASDYLTKPIQTDQLLSLMRVWMYK